MRRAAILAAVILAAPGFSARAHAQDTVGEVIGFLVTNQAVATGDFEKDRAAAEAARQTISRALLVNLTSMPLATSSSGFLYRLNPQLGTVERATESFGGFFIERALTPGRGHASFGMSATTSAFDRLDGDNLRDGSLVTIANRFRDEPAAFDTEALTLEIRSSTMTLFGSYGVTDRLEIGAALPLVQLTINGRRINNYRGDTFLQASGTASSSGIADIALRSKYTLVAGPSGGAAVAGEVRLPTGDEENLLGAGAMSYRVTGIGSFEHDRLAVQGNVAAVGGGVSGELAFGGGASFAVAPRVTVLGEALVRRVAALHDTLLLSAPHPTIAGVDTLRLVAGTSSTTLSTAVAGVKWNVTSTVVIGGHIMWSPSKRGLTAPLTPTIGLEYAF